MLHSWIMFANLTWMCDVVSIFSKVDNAPRPQKFFEEYVKLSKAAIFRGAIKATKGFKIWEDSYMREHYGDLEVRLEAKKEKVFSFVLSVQDIDQQPISETYMRIDSEK